MVQLCLATYHINKAQAKKKQKKFITINFVISQCQEIDNNLAHIIYLIYHSQIMFTKISGSGVVAEFCSKTDIITFPTIA